MVDVMISVSALSLVVIVDVFRLVIRCSGMIGADVYITCGWGTKGCVLI